MSSKTDDLQLIEDYDTSSSILDAFNEKANDSQIKPLGQPGEYANIINSANKDKDNALEGAMPNISYIDIPTVNLVPLAGAGPDAGPGAGTGEPDPTEEPAQDTSVEVISSMRKFKADKGLFAYDTLETNELYKKNLGITKLDDLKKTLNIGEDESFADFQRKGGYVPEGYKIAFKQALAQEKRLKTYTKYQSGEMSREDFLYEAYGKDLLKSQGIDFNSTAYWVENVRENNGVAKNPLNDIAFLDSLIEQCENKFVADEFFSFFNSASNSLNSAFDLVKSADNASGTKVNGKTFGDLFFPEGASEYTDAIRAELIEAFGSMDEVLKAYIQGKLQPQTEIFSPFLDVDGDGKKDYYLHTNGVLYAIKGNGSKGKGEKTCVVEYDSEDKVRSVTIGGALGDYYNVGHMFVDSARSAARGVTDIVGIVAGAAGGLIGLFTGGADGAKENFMDVYGAYTGAVNEIGILNSNRVIFGEKTTTEKIQDGAVMIGDIAINLVLAYFTCGGSAAAKAGAKAGQTAAKVAIKELTEESIEQVGKQIGKKTATTLTKAATKEVGEAVGKKIGQEVGEAVGKKIGKEVAEGAGKAISNQVLRKQAISELVEQKVKKDLAGFAGNKAATQAYLDGMRKELFKKFGKEFSEGFGKKATKEFFGGVVTSAAAKVGTPYTATTASSAFFQGLKGMFVGDNSAVQLASRARGGSLTQTLPGIRGSRWLRSIASSAELSTRGALQVYANLENQNEQMKLFTQLANSDNEQVAAVFSQGNYRVLSDSEIFKRTTTVFLSNFAISSVFRAMGSDTLTSRIASIGKKSDDVLARKALLEASNHKVLNKLMFSKGAMMLDSAADIFENIFTNSMEAAMLDTTQEIGDFGAFANTFKETLLSPQMIVSNLYVAVNNSTNTRFWSSIKTDKTNAMLSSIASNKAAIDISTVQKSANNYFDRLISKAATPEEKIELQNRKMAVETAFVQKLNELAKSEEYAAKDSFAKNLENMDVIDSIVRVTGEKDLEIKLEIIGIVDKPTQNAIVKFYNQHKDSLQDGDSDIGVASLVVSYNMNQVNKVKSEEFLKELMLNAGLVNKKLMKKVEAISDTENLKKRLKRQKDKYDTALEQIKATVGNNYTVDFGPSLVDDVLRETIPHLADSLPESRESFEKIMGKGLSSTVLTPREIFSDGKREIIVDKDGEVKYVDKNGAKVAGETNDQATAFMKMMADPNVRQELIDRGIISLDENGKVIVEPSTYITCYKVNKADVNNQRAAVADGVVTPETALDIICNINDSFDMYYSGLYTANTPKLTKVEMGEGDNKETYFILGSINTSNESESLTEMNSIWAVKEQVADMVNLYKKRTEVDPLSFAKEKAMTLSHFGAVAQYIVNDPNEVKDFEDFMKSLANAKTEEEVRNIVADTKTNTYSKYAIKGLAIMLASADVSQETALDGKLGASQIRALVESGILSKDLFDKIKTELHNAYSGGGGEEFKKNLSASLDYAKEFATLREDLDFTLKTMTAMSAKSNAISGITSDDEKRLRQIATKLNEVGMYKSAYEGYLKDGKIGEVLEKFLKEIADPDFFVAGLQVTNALRHSVSEIQTKLSTAKNEKERQKILSELDDSVDAIVEEIAKFGGKKPEDNTEAFKVDLKARVRQLANLKYSGTERNDSMNGYVTVSILDLCPKSVDDAMAVFVKDLNSASKSHSEIQEGLSKLEKATSGANSKMQADAVKKLREKAIFSDGKYILTLDTTNPDDRHLLSNLLASLGYESNLDYAKDSDTPIPGVVFHKTTQVVSCDVSYDAVTEGLTKLIEDFAAKQLFESKSEYLDADLFIRNLFSNLNYRSFTEDELETLADTEFGIELIASNDATFVADYVKQSRDRLIKGNLTGSAFAKVYLHSMLGIRPNKYTTESKNTVLINNIFDIVEKADTDFKNLPAHIEFKYSDKLNQEIKDVADDVYFLYNYKVEDNKCILDLAPNYKQRLASYKQHIASGEIDTEFDIRKLIPIFRMSRGKYSMPIGFDTAQRSSVVNALASNKLFVEYVIGKNYNPESSYSLDTICKAFARKAKGGSLKIKDYLAFSDEAKDAARNDSNDAWNTSTHKKNYYRERINSELQIRKQYADAVKAAMGDKLDLVKPFVEENFFKAFSEAYEDETVRSLLFTKGDLTSEEIRTIKDSFKGIPLSDEQVKFLQEYISTYSGNVLVKSQENVMNVYSELSQALAKVLMYKTKGDGRKVVAINIEEFISLSKTERREVIDNLEKIRDSIPGVNKEDFNDMLKVLESKSGAIKDDADETIVSYKMTHPTQPSQEIDYIHGFLTTGGRPSEIIDAAINREIKKANNKKKIVRLSSLDTTSSGLSKALIEAKKQIFNKFTYAYSDKANSMMVANWDSMDAIADEIIKLSDVLSRVQQKDTAGFYQDDITKAMIVLDSMTAGAKYQSSYGGAVILRQRVDDDGETTTDIIPVEVTSRNADDDLYAVLSGQTAVRYIGEDGNVKEDFIRAYLKDNAKESYLVITADKDGFAKMQKGDTSAVKLLNLNDDKVKRQVANQMIRNAVIKTNSTNIKNEAEMQKRVQNYYRSLSGYYPSYNELYYHLYQTAIDNGIDQEVAMALLPRIEDRDDYYEFTQKDEALARTIMGDDVDEAAKHTNSKLKLLSNILRHGIDESTMSEEELTILSNYASELRKANRSILGKAAKLIDDEIDELIKGNKDITVDSIMKNLKEKAIDIAEAAIKNVETYHTEKIRLSENIAELKRIYEDNFKDDKDDTPGNVFKDFKYTFKKDKGKKTASLSFEDTINLLEKTLTNANFKEYNKHISALREQLRTFLLGKSKEGTDAIKAYKGRSISYWNRKEKKKLKDVVDSLRESFKENFGNDNKSTPGSAFLRFKYSVYGKKGEVKTYSFEEAINLLEEALNKRNFGSFNYHVSHLRNQLEARLRGGADATKDAVEIYKDRTIDFTNRRYNTKIWDWSKNTSGKVKAMDSILNKFLTQVKTDLNFTPKVDAMDKILKNLLDDRGLDCNIKDGRVERLKALYKRADVNYPDDETKIDNKEDREKLEAYLERFAKDYATQQIALKRHNTTDLVRLFGIEGDDSMDNVRYTTADGDTYITGVEDGKMFFKYTDADGKEKTIKKYASFDTEWLIRKDKKDFDLDQEGNPLYQIGLAIVDETGNKKLYSIVIDETLKKVSDDNSIYDTVDKDALALLGDNSVIHVASAEESVAKMNQLLGTEEIVLVGFNNKNDNALSDNSLLTRAGLTLENKIMLDFQNEVMPNNILKPIEHLTSTSVESLGKDLGIAKSETHNASSDADLQLKIMLKILEDQQKFIADYKTSYKEIEEENAMFGVIGNDIYDKDFIQLKRKKQIAADKIRLHENRYKQMLDAYTAVTINRIKRKSELKHLNSALFELKANSVMPEYKRNYFNALKNSKQRSKINRNITGLLVELMGDSPEAFARKLETILNPDNKNTKLYKDTVAGLKKGILDATTIIEKAAGYYVAIEDGKKQFLKPLKSNEQKVQEFLTNASETDINKYLSAAYKEAIASASEDPSVEERRMSDYVKDFEKNAEGPLLWIGNDSDRLVSMMTKALKDPKANLVLAVKDLNKVGVDPVIAKQYKNANRYIIEPLAKMFGLESGDPEYFSEATKALKEDPILEGFSKDLNSLIMNDLIKIYGADETVIRNISDRVTQMKNEHGRVVSVYHSEDFYKSIFDYFFGEKGKLNKNLVSSPGLRVQAVEDQSIPYGEVRVSKTNAEKLLRNGKIVRDKDDGSFYTFALRYPLAIQDNIHIIKVTVNENIGAPGLAMSTGTSKNFFNGDFDGDSFYLMSGECPVFSGVDTDTLKKIHSARTANADIVSDITREIKVPSEAASFVETKVYKDLATNKAFKDEFIGIYKEAISSRDISAANEKLSDLLKKNNIPEGEIKEILDVFGFKSYNGEPYTSYAVFISGDEETSRYQRDVFLKVISSEYPQKTSYIDKTIGQDNKYYPVRKRKSNITKGKVTPKFAEKLTVRHDPIATEESRAKLKYSLSKMDVGENSEVITKIETLTGIKDLAQKLSIDNVNRDLVLDEVVEALDLYSRVATQKSYNSEYYKGVATLLNASNEINNEQLFKYYEQLYNFASTMYEMNSDTKASKDQFFENPMENLLSLMCVFPEARQLVGNYGSVYKKYKDNDQFKAKLVNAALKSFDDETRVLSAEDVCSERGGNLGFVNCRVKVYKSEAKGFNDQIVANPNSTTINDTKFVVINKVDIGERYSVDTVEKILENDGRTTNHDLLKELDISRNLNEEIVFDGVVTNSEKRYSFKDNKDDIKYLLQNGTPCKLIYHTEIGWDKALEAAGSMKVSAAGSKDFKGVTYLASEDQIKEYGFKDPTVDFVCGDSIFKEKLNPVDNTAKVVEERSDYVIYELNGVNLLDTSNLDSYTRIKDRRIDKGGILQGSGSVGALALTGNLFFKIENGKLVFDAGNSDVGDAEYDKLTGVKGLFSLINNEFVLSKSNTLTDIDAAQTVMSLRIMTLVNFLKSKKVKDLDIDSMVKTYCGENVLAEGSNEMLYNQKGNASKYGFAFEAKLCSILLKNGLEDEFVSFLETSPIGKTIFSEDIDMQLKGKVVTGGDSSGEDIASKSSAKHSPKKKFSKGYINFEEKAELASESKYQSLNAGHLSAKSLLAAILKNATGSDANLKSLEDLILLGEIEPVNAVSTGIVDEFTSVPANQAIRRATPTATQSNPKSGSRVDLTEVTELYPMSSPMLAETDVVNPHGRIQRDDAEFANDEFSERKQTMNFADKKYTTISAISAAYTDGSTEEIMNNFELNKQRVAQNFHNTYVGLEESGEFGFRLDEYNTTDKTKSKDGKFSVSKPQTVDEYKEMVKERTKQPYQVQYKLRKEKERAKKREELGININDPFDYIKESLEPKAYSIETLKENSPGVYKFFEEHKATLLEMDETQFSKKGDWRIIRELSKEVTSEDIKEAVYRSIAIHSKDNNRKVKQVLLDNAYGIGDLDGGMKSIDLGSRVHNMTESENEFARQIDQGDLSYLVLMSNSCPGLTGQLSKYMRVESVIDAYQRLVTDKDKFVKKLGQSTYDKYLNETINQIKSIVPGEGDVDSKIKALEQIQIEILNSDHLLASMCAAASRLTQRIGTMMRAKNEFTILGYLAAGPSETSDSPWIGFKNVRKAVSYGEDFLSSIAYDFSKETPRRRFSFFHNEDSGFIPMINKVVRSMAREEVHKDFANFMKDSGYMRNDSTTKAAFNAFEEGLESYYSQDDSNTQEKELNAHTFYVLRAKCLERGLSKSDLPAKYSSRKDLLVLFNKIREGATRILGTNGSVGDNIDLYFEKLRMADNPSQKKALRNMLDTLALYQDAMSIGLGQLRETETYKDINETVISRVRQAAEASDKVVVDRFGRKVFNEDEWKTYDRVLFMDDLIRNFYSTEGEEKETFLISSAMRGDLFLMDKTVADQLERKLFSTRVNSKINNGLKKIKNFLTGLIMNSPLQLIDRAINFPMFDAGIICGADIGNTKQMSRSLAIINKFKAATKSMTDEQVAADPELSKLVRFFAATGTDLYQPETVHGEHAAKLSIPVIREYLQFSNRLFTEGNLVPRFAYFLNLIDSAETNMKNNGEYIFAKNKCGAAIHRYEDFVGTYGDLNSGVSPKSKDFEGSKMYNIDGVDPRLVAKCDAAAAEVISQHNGIEGNMPYIANYMNRNFNTMFLSFPMALLRWGKNRIKSIGYAFSGDMSSNDSFKYLLNQTGSALITSSIMLLIQLMFSEDSREYLFGDKEEMSEEEKENATNIVFRGGCVRLFDSMMKGEEITSTSHSRSPVAGLFDSYVADFIPAYNPKVEKDGIFKTLWKKIVEKTWGHTNFAVKDVVESIPGNTVLQSASWYTPGPDFFDNYARKVTGYTLGSAQSKAFYDYLSVYDDEYEASKLKTIYDGLEYAYSTKYANTKEGRSEYKNYKRAFTIVNDYYKYIYSGERSDTKFGGTGDTMRRDLQTIVETSNSPEKLYDYIQDRIESGVSYSDISKALRSASIRGKLFALGSLQKDFLSSLNEKDYNTVKTALLYEDNMYPFLEEVVVDVNDKSLEEWKKANGYDDSDRMYANQNALNKVGTLVRNWNYAHGGSGIYSNSYNNSNRYSSYFNSRYNNYSNTGYDSYGYRDYLSDPLEAYEQAQKNIRYGDAKDLYGNIYSKYINNYNNRRSY